MRSLLLLIALLIVTTLTTVPARAAVDKATIDAAIDRFEDATIAKPGYAIPYRYLGEAYEKKGKKKPALKAYQKYLDLYPHAEDGDKIRKRVEKLHEEIDKGNS